MSELTLDLSQGRFGVLHCPHAEGPVMFVLLNAGAVHRQGPFRLYVHLARRLAALGYASFRFDQPGIGDAVLAADRPQVALLSDVLDRLQANTGCTRFVVGGICSAADAAWQLAQKDQRVTGLLLLDPVAYAPRWFALGRLLRLRTPAALIASLRLRLIGLKVGQAATAQAEETDYREWPSPHAVAGQLASLCARGVEVFALYTGGIAHYFLHRRQFSATFGRASRDPRVRFQYWPEIDHLFYRPADRERVLSNLCAWAQERFPRDPLSAPLPPS